jgi:hypothetical protein
MSNKIFIAHVFGWSTNCNDWYLAYVNNSNYHEIVNWLYDNVQGCEKHCRWRFFHQYMEVKFRHERDFVWFNLVWR